MIFKVCIEEHVTGLFDIEARNSTEAIVLAEEMYKEGELDLEEGEVRDRRICVRYPDTNIFTDWEEF